jgi:uncharacterized protein with NRDE domain
MHRRPVQHDAPAAGARPEVPHPMCLIVFAIDPTADLRLVVAANRDEFFARPTEPSHWWPDMPALHAGRDREQGGTWLALHRDGRFAAITNVRDPGRRHPDPRSRGLLVRDALVDHASAAEAAATAWAERDAYDGFNLITVDTHDARHVDNRAGAGAPTRIERGVHGVSNAVLDTPWPKLVRARAALVRALDLATDATRFEHALFALLDDRTPVDDADLPATGVSLDWERRLSTARIVGDDYGTRCSTVLVWHRDGRVAWVERTWQPGGVPGSEVRMTTRVPASTAFDAIVAA